MTEFQRGFLSLIKAALLDEPLSMPSSYDYNAAYTLAEKQQLTPMIYYGAMNDPAFVGSALETAYMARSCVYIGHDADQRDTVQQICDALEAADIDHMPLKGTLLKPMYPSPEMRTMGDMDILIRTEDYGRIEAVMTELGCTFDGESDHEYNWYTATGLLVELHKRLIPSYNEDYYAYYGDGWRLARVAEGYTHRYELSPEDLYIYLFTHYAKHFRDQGAGIKYMTDFYLYRRTYPALDMTYIERELLRLQLLEFHENIQRLLAAWFDGAPEDELTDYLTARVFDDGAFGDAKWSALSEGLRLSKSGTKARTKKKRDLLFPPYKVMCLRYPFLKHWAILLPLMWMVRWFDVLFFHRDRYRNQMKRVEEMSDESVSQYRRELNYVGLDFNFGEDDEPSEPPNEASPHTMP